MLDRFTHFTQTQAMLEGDADTRSTNFTKSIIYWTDTKL